MAQRRIMNVAALVALVVGLIAGGVAAPHVAADGVLDGVIGSEYGATRAIDGAGNDAANGDSESCPVADGNRGNLMELHATNKPGNDEWYFAFVVDSSQALNSTTGNFFGKGDSMTVNYMLGIDVGCNGGPAGDMNSGSWKRFFSWQGAKYNNANPGVDYFIPMYPTGADALNAALWSMSGATKTLLQADIPVTTRVVDYRRHVELRLDPALAGVPADLKTNSQLCLALMTTENSDNVNGNGGRVLDDLGEAGSVTGCDLSYRLDGAGGNGPMPVKVATQPACQANGRPLPGGSATRQCTSFPARTTVTALDSSRRLRDRPTGRQHRWQHRGQLRAAHRGGLRRPLPGRRRGALRLRRRVRGLQLLDRQRHDHLHELRQRRYPRRSRTDRRALPLPQRQRPRPDRVRRPGPDGGPAGRLGQSLPGARPGQRRQHHRPRGPRRRAGGLHPAGRRRRGCGQPPRRPAHQLPRLGARFHHRDGLGRVMTARRQAQRCGRWNNGSDTWDLTAPFQFTTVETTVSSPSGVLPFNTAYYAAPNQPPTATALVFGREPTSYEFAIPWDALGGKPPLATQIRLGAYTGYNPDGWDANDQAPGIGQGANGLGSHERIGDLADENDNEADAGAAGNDRTPYVGRTHGQNLRAPGSDNTAGDSDTIEAYFVFTQDPAMYNCPSPLAVDLAAFTATAGADGVTLAWETVSETDNAGFNVYRAEGGSVGAPADNRGILSCRRSLDQAERRADPGRGPGVERGAHVHLDRRRRHCGRRAGRQLSVPAGGRGARWDGHPA